MKNMKGHMKNSLTIIIILLSDMFFEILTIKIFCNSYYNITPDLLTTGGGTYITALGALKVLVVFAKLKDDTSSHPYWPVDSYPSEMNNFIDLDMQKGSTHFLNLTNYYNQMSFGKFKVTGKSIGAETPYPASHYIMPNKNCLNRSMAITDILKSIDDSIDYREFDNWTYSSNYNHRKSPDGIVDMIIVIWRGLVFDEQWSGESSLGYGPGFLVENNQEEIRMGYYYYTDNLIFGSGVTVQYWGERSRERNFKNCIHEVAHWLIQKEHPYSKFNHTFWGMLTLGSEGICANTIEREKLGWINPKLITDTTLVIGIGDYVTISSSVKYHPPNGLPNEYFYFENHQKLSLYDDATSNLNDKGIFILQVSDNNYYTGDCVRVLTSDGFWDWDSPKHSDCWGNDLPAFQKKFVNRNGFGNRDKIGLSDSCRSFLYSFISKDGEIECNDWLHGYGFKNSFDTLFNDVFSPWSNPPVKTCKGQLVDFSMEVIRKIGSVITVGFINQNAVQSKPSKPALGVDQRESYDQNHFNIIRLVWGADNWDGLPIEPDVIWSELQIKIDSSNWSTIYSGSNRFWNDSNFVYDELGEVFVSFRVRMCDNENKCSMWSDVYETMKIINNTTPMSDINFYHLTEYYLYQNFPNPFNPTTTIIYSIPKLSFVTLRIYDVLGSEVETLINEEKAVGTYELNWNAANLPSGVYFYRLQAGSFVETKKMILLK